MRRGTPADAIDWPALETITHRDPGQRGLASYRRKGAALDAGNLRAASVHLAEHARGVAIVTGFPAVVDERVTAETDGPPGALFLAYVLRTLGLEVSIITDRVALAMLRTGAAQVGLDSAIVREFPFAVDDSRRNCIAWIDAFLASGPWTHLVAIERPGPSHTAESFRAQRRDVPVPLETFQAAVPEAARDACHTMLGERIDDHVAPAQLLFEAIAQRQLPITTIAIGDGGNELGLGSFLWEDLVAAIATGPAGQIACRVAADFPLLAGTSNWGAYALALAAARLRGVSVETALLSPDGTQRLLAALVAAGAVDGRTRRAEPTVDGLAPDDYQDVLNQMSAVLERMD